ncbi:TPA: hypothetical protein N0F65_000421 [Lagenidium giganteum]|uniref:Aldehyde dehydrogenase n=1 Tax=Lagenidium giganteum TaxID=4803 RepID=A0AAV2YLI5_9STRA|nr:TPA: hypothetical protein N0F65_000421 [Lagenidium giganteum]
MVSTRATIEQDVQELRRTFNSGATKDVKTRRRLLQQLQRMLNEGLPAIKEALWKDLRKHSLEAHVHELSVVLHEVQTHLDYFEDWAQPERVGTNLLNLPGSSYVYKDPLGVVCIIGTWNYPFQVLFTPLVGALSAGNCALLRLPGDDTCVHVIEVMKNLLDKYMDKQFVRYVHGGVEATQATLDQKFDLIFCTSGPFLGKIVAQAAAKTLTPVVLELGGKSPVIVHKDCDLDVTARRIAWAAFANAGQTCIRADYVLVDSSVGDELVKRISDNVRAFYGENPEESDCLGRLINPKSFDRVSGLLEQDRKYVVSGGNSNAKIRYIEPTVLSFKKDLAAFQSSAVMSEEIFGPLLPVCYFDDVSQAIDHVNANPKPLSLYIFTRSNSFRDRILTSTSSGGVTVNDCLVHASNSNLPFGGVGNSGHGAYHGKLTFDVFTHHKSVLVKSFALDVKERYAPYTPFAERLMLFLLKPVPRRFVSSIKWTSFVLVLAVVGALLKRRMRFAQ